MTDLLSDGDTSEQQKLKIFISYSRKDVGFADQLVRLLEDRGFDPVIDRHGIDAADKWKDRLEELIFSA